MISRRTIQGSLLPLLLALAPTAPLAADCDRIADCELVWADEFDGDAVDPDRWEFQTGTGTAYGLPSGWGNNELQYYQAANATVADGLLTLTARREAVGGKSYTSARLRSLGRGEWTYGRMEMRARMPLGKGLWPAFWMLPSDPRYGTWAASGEIDIMEYLGNEPERVLGTIHFGSPWPQNAFSGKSYDLPSGSFAEDFHVFAVEWERGQIRWYVDDVLFATQTDWFSSAAPYPAPFDVDFHLLLNVAVGGNLPGAPDGTTSFPQQMVVDYVRVYQAPPATGAQTATTNLIYEEPVRLKQVTGSVALPFANQARTRGRGSDPRRVDCSVSAFGSAASSVRVKGKLELVAAGAIGSTVWADSIGARLDRAGAGTFDADAIAELLDRAASAGASVERLEATFKGKGGKKTTRVDVVCRHQEG